MSQFHFPLKRMGQHSPKISLNHEFVFKVLEVHTLFMNYYKQNQKVRRVMYFSDKDTEAGRVSKVPRS